MAPRHVFHASRPLQGGVPRVAAALVADQVARGLRLTVACPDESDLRADALAAGAEHVSWAATRSPGPTTAGETVRLARLIRAAAPDVVHLHSSKAGLAGRLALRGRLPTIFQPHGWSFDMATGATSRAAASWERIGARWTHALVCVSDGERRRGEAAGIRAPWEVIPNGVDLARYAPAAPGEREASRRDLGVEPDVPLAVLAGRLCVEKGQDLMIELWPQVRARVPGATLALVGDGEPDQRAALEAAAGEGVRFAGWRDDIGPWLAAADVVAVPSRSEAGLSLVAMEAMARGRSVVASDVSGMRDGLGEGAGAIVAIEAREPLVEALSTRLADRARADAEGEAGRRRVEAQFDLHAASGRMVELYERLLAG